jgi:peptidoglycan L-alanyl-D-glutamate endopeptidase CwlK
MFKFGQRSLDELQGVHPTLVKVTEHALIDTLVDFGVHDGCRTAEEQRELVRSGASKTLASFHIPDATSRSQGIATGFGQAVDLVPYINGKLRWEWEPIYMIATAMRNNLNYLAVNERIRWGAVWDRTLDQLNPLDLESERDAYIERRKQAGRKAFCDGPHFQLEVYLHD